MSGRAATVKPLIVCCVVKVVIIASTMAGASSGEGAMLSTRCLKVQTPLRESADAASNTVRSGSSTTETFLIMSSRGVLT
jgi:hypothetical protein